MATWQRIAVAVTWTISITVGGILYQRVFVGTLLPLVDMDGKFVTPVIWMDRIAPLALVILLVAVWTWVIAGAVQDEQTVNRRQVR